jgi:TldD protein
VGSGPAEYSGPAPGLAEKVLSRALRAGGDTADLFIEERRSLSLRLEDGRVENVVSGSDLGGSIRIGTGDSTVFGYVDSCEESSLLSLADELRRSDRGRAGLLPTLTPVPVSSGGKVVVDPRTAEAAVKSRLLHLGDEVARGAGREIRQVMAVYGETRQRVWMAGSQGFRAADDRTRVLFAITVMAQRDGVIQTGHDTLAHHGGFELLSDEAVTELATTAAERAILLLGGRPAPAGRMPVVLGNGFGGVLFHEACGHGLEADYVLKRSSVWEGKRGERVANDHLFAYDDGVAKGMWGSGGCDDEGVPCQRTTLIEAGVLTAYLTDRLRAAALHLPLTGNGRRQDYRSLPYPRMTNTYLGPGAATAEELIADTRKGLYAKSLTGGEVNPATGEFVFAVEEGYLIEGGRVAAPVRGATLVGNGPEVLKAIDAVGDDLAIKAGTCGKEGQGVPVGSGQPTVRIRELTIGGTGLG